MAFVVIETIVHSPEAGGRKHPFNEGYCPHLVSSGSDVYLPVRLVECPAYVFPGERRSLTFQLLYHPKLDYSGLRVGSVADVVEGCTIVGTGKVVASDAS